LLHNTTLGRVTPGNGCACLNVPRFSSSGVAQSPISTNTYQKDMYLWKANGYNGFWTHATPPCGVSRARASSSNAFLEGTCVPIRGPLFQGQGLVCLRLGRGGLTKISHPSPSCWPWLLWPPTPLGVRGPLVLLMLREARCKRRRREPSETPGRYFIVFYIV
jgi:hypothetical protein